MRESREFTHAGNPDSFPLPTCWMTLPPRVPVTCSCLRDPKVEASVCSGSLLSGAVGCGLFLLCYPARFTSARYCTEGKRTFSSRLILEKHVQVRHGLPLGTQSPSGRGGTLVRGSGGRSQVRRGPPDTMSRE